MKIIATILAMMIFSIATINAQRPSESNRHENRRGQRSEVRNDNKSRNDRKDRKENARPGNDRKENAKPRNEHKEHAKPNNERRHEDRRHEFNDGGRHGRPDKIHDYRPTPSPHSPAAANRHHGPAPRHIPMPHIGHRHNYGHGPIVVRDHIHYIVAPAPIYGAVPVRHNLPFGYISTKVLLNIPNISTIYDFKLSIPLPNYIKVVNEYKAFGEHNYVRDADLVLEVIEVGADIMNHPIYALALIDLHAQDNNVVATWEIEHTYGDIRWSIERCLDRNEKEIAAIIKEWDYRYMSYVF